MSTDDTLQYLVIISFQLNRIVPIFQIILGTFGNIMNILIFTRRSLRTNPCSFYFLASSINNLFVLYIALLTRLLSSGWQIDPSNLNIILCKLRIFFVYLSLCLIQWFVVLASIDRFFSSCHNIRYRQLSNLRLAKKAIILTIFLTALIHIHILIWWTVDYIETELYCNIFSYEYEVAFQLFFLTFFGILPPVFMTIFGILTILNVRKIRMQVAPTQNVPRRHEQRSRLKDRQLIGMLLIQVIITIFCTAPFVTANIFDMIVNYIDKVIYSIRIKAFFDNLCRLMLYFNPMIGFYINTLSSRVFRIEMKRIIKQGIKFICEKSCLKRFF